MDWLIVRSRNRNRVAWQYHGPLHDSIICTPRTLYAMHAWCNDWHGHGFMVSRSVTCVPSIHVRVTRCSMILPLSWPLGSHACMVSLSRTAC